MEDQQSNYGRIVLLLLEVRDLISLELGSNPYDDLGKSINIVSTSNLKDFSLIHKKLKNLSMLLYNRSFENSKLIFGKLDEINFIITEKAQS